MYFTMRSLLLMLSVMLFLVCLIYLNTTAITVSQQLISIHRRGDVENSLKDILEGVPDSRVRLSKLEITSQYGPISMWVAFPSSENVVPGTNWYTQLWDDHSFGGVHVIDAMISLAPCKQYDSTFIQIGAHLGIFPLVASYRGCRGIAVEAMPAATNFTRISAKINNWEDNEFLAINAAVGDVTDRYVWFDPKNIAISTDDSDVNGKLRVPLTTLDALNTQYGGVRTSGKSRIAFVTIDVEGHEQEVLLGAKSLIEQQSVIVFEIEVWTKQSIRGVVSHFPGLQLLVKNKYRLYAFVSNSAMNFKRCDEITNRLTELSNIFNETCQPASTAKGSICSGEVFAVRADILPLRRWFHQCTQ